MPDSTIYSTTSDGVINYQNSIVGNARLNATGTVSDSDTTALVGIDRIPAGRGAFYNYIRAFFLFDLSSESGTVDSADLKLYQNTTRDQWFKAVEWSSSSTSLSSGDYDSVMVSLGTMNAYSTKIRATSAGSGYLTFPMNSDAITDIQSAVGSGLFRIAVVADEDAIGSLTISSDHLETFTFSNSGINKPKLEITYTAGVTYNAPFLGANF